MVYHVSEIKFHSTQGLATVQPEADKCSLKKVCPLKKIQFVSAAASEECTELYCSMWVNAVSFS